jgi:cytochrome c oxidase subunit 2
MMVRGGLIVVLAAGLAACSGPQSVLAPHGPQAQSLAWLIWTIVAVCCVVWALVIVALAAALVRPQRRRKGDPAAQRRLSIVVGTATAGTVIVIAAFTFISFRATASLQPAGPYPVTIHVRAYQWWWEVTYPDAEDGGSFVTANEIHVPVGEPVRVQLSAADVIHSFWIPSLAGKQDLIPGRTTEIVVSASSPGVYRGQCAEFCGFQHAHMALSVVADEKDAFEAWKASQRQSAAAPDNDDTRDGERVFTRGACAGCHTIRGTAAVGRTGPDLTHVGSRRTIGAGLFETTQGSLAAWIADPQALKPGNTMPQVSLSPAELKALAAYMASLK